MGCGRVRVSHAHACGPAARSRYVGARGGDASGAGTRYTSLARDGRASSQPGDPPAVGASEGDDQADCVQPNTRAHAQAAGDDSPWTDAARDDSACTCTWTDAEAADTCTDACTDTRTDARTDARATASGRRSRVVRERARGPSGGSADRDQTRATVPGPGRYTLAIPASLYGEAAVAAIVGNFDFTLACVSSGDDAS